MTTFHSRSALKDVLAQADARAVVERDRTGSARLCAGYQR